MPQGSVLGPLLFLIFINDIPKYPNTEISLFADDTAITAKSYRIDTIVNRLNKAAQKIFKYFKYWKIQLNTDKTEAILFTKRRPITNETVCINNTNIEWSSHAKYLGLNLDKKLTFTYHINTICDKAIGVMSNLFPIFNINFKLSKHNKLILYTAMIRSILTYACPVWNFTCDSNIKKLQIVQNKCLRIIGNYPRYTPCYIMHEQLNIEYIYNFIRNISTNFFSKIKDNKNQLISNIANYDIKIKHKHKRIKLITK